ncbi:hypothetical protein N7467_001448 [Penicillium canescens]|nr:hypothetical protein N7467_001448 [Penicillium canescens]
MSITRLAKVETQTLRLLQPTYRTTKAIDSFIQDHPVTRALRANPKFTESRPHLNGPELLRDRKLLSDPLQAHK